MDLLFLVIVLLLLGAVRSAWDLVVRVGQAKYAGGGRRGECRSTGLWFSGHPLELFAPAEALRGATPAAALPDHLGRRVAVAGLPCAWRRVETRSGGLMLFLTVADQSGLAECVMFPPVYRALAGRSSQVWSGQVVRVEGRVEETLDAVTLTVDGAKTLA